MLHRRLKRGILRVLGSQAWRMRGISLPSRLQARALDVGCGLGFFVRALRDLGWRAWGMDISAPELRHATRVTPHLLLGDSHTLPFASHTFDALFFWHVLEHLENPRKALREAHRILQPGGIVLIEVPNLASVQARAFGNRWFHLAFDVHFWHFNPTTLRLLMERGGFTHVHVWTEANGVGWVRSLGWGNGWEWLFTLGDMLLSCAGAGGVVRALAQKGVPSAYPASN